MPCHRQSPSASKSGAATPACSSGPTWACLETYAVGLRGACLLAVFAITFGTFLGAGVLTGRHYDREVRGRFYSCAPISSSNSTPQAPTPPAQEASQSKPG